MKKALLFSIVLSLFSCVPSIHYLGDSYNPVDKIDIYYDREDVKQDHEVIGRLANGKQFRFGTERIKEAMIKKAQEQGGDAIVFVNFGSSTDAGIDNVSGDFRSVEAILIKYL